MKHIHIRASLLPSVPLAALLLIGACATTHDAPAAPAKSTTAAEPAKPAVAAEPAKPAAPAVAAAPVAPPPAPAGQPGAPGIGDPLFPTMGNGGYDVQSYDLVISLDAAGGPIDATTSIRAKSTQALSRFDLDLHALEVHSVEVDGAAATFAREEDELVVTPAHPIANGAEFAVVVRYGGVPEGVLDPSFPVPLKLGWMTKDGEVYVVSQPSGAKTFFPCNDHPRDKALFTLHVTVPKPLMVIGNGTLAETIDAGDKRTFVYRPRDPIATYLVTLAIGEFDETELAGPNGLVIKNHFSSKTKASSRKSFDRTPAIITFLGDTFGAYPFETCGNILSSMELPGALETQTLPTFGAHAGGESIICHEQAHQWFGDTVSVENWQDIWLNEGFAEYAAWMYVESTKGAEQFEKTVRSHYGSYRSMSQRKPGGDVAEAAADAEPPPGRPTIDSMFGSAVYVRGPLALHALRTEVGNEAFLALMRSWVQEHRYANASIADFLAHVEKSTTPAARAVVEHWIYDAEMPHVAAWDEQLAKEKAERDAKRKAREQEKLDKQKAEEKPADGEKKDG